MERAKCHYTTKCRRDKNAIANNELIYSTIGNGKLEKGDLEKLAKKFESGEREPAALSGRAYPQQQLTSSSSEGAPSASPLPSRVLDLGIVKENGLSKTKHIASLLVDKLQEILNKPITNHNSGLSGVLTKDSINKISSSKAVNKSLDNGFSKEEHFAAAQNISWSKRERGAISLACISTSHSMMRARS